MPNITPYDAGNLAIRPTEVGVESQAAAGRRLGAYGSQIAGAYERAGQNIGRAVKEAGDTAVAYADTQQINAGADQSSKMWANLEDSWNKTSSAADPHDPSTAKKWREEQLEPALSQFQEGFTTQKSQEWANRTVNSMRQHFFVQTEGEMSRIAKVAASNTAESMRDNLSAAALANPAGVSGLLQHVDDSLGSIVDSYPNIKGTDAAAAKLELGDKIKRAIAHGGALGAITNGGDPEAALAGYLKNPDVAKYVNATEEASMAKAARIQAKQNTLLATQIQNEQKRVAENNMHRFLNDSSTNNVVINPDGTINISSRFVEDVNAITKQFPNAPDAWRVKEQMGNWIKHQQDNPKGGVSDAGTVQQLDSRLFDADNPTTIMDLRRAQIMGKLSNRDFSMREGLIKDRDAEPIKDPTFKWATDQAKIAIEGNTPGTKLYAGGKYAAFMQKFQGEYLKESRSGTLPPNALDLTDENSLISKMLKPYRMNLGQSISANGGVGAPRPKPAPPPPGTPMVGM